MQRGIGDPSVDLLTKEAPRDPEIYIAPPKKEFSTRFTRIFLLSVKDKVGLV